MRLNWRALVPTGSYKFSWFDIEFFAKLILPCLFVRVPALGPWGYSSSSCKLLFVSWINNSLLLGNFGDWSSKAESFSEIIELSFYDKTSSD